MLTVQKKLWFRLCAVFTAGSTCWFACVGTVWAATPRGAGDGYAVADVAKRLGLEPEAVKRGPAFEKAEKQRNEQRRADALARLQKLMGPDPIAMAEARSHAAAIEKAHLPDLLAGAAKAADEARRGATKKDVGGKRVAAAQVALDNALDRAEKQGAGKTPGLGSAISRARSFSKLLAKGGSP